MTLSRIVASLAAAMLVTASAAAPVKAETAAERAVEAAKKYSGSEISVVWEAGLQSLDPLNFSGPRWEKLTGIKIKVIEVPTAEMFTKILQEHRAGTGAYDALNVAPSWMPDLVRAGALEQLDSYVDKYGFRDELQKIAPTYRDNQMKVDGKIYGFPDDGDIFILYYRKDLFEDAKNKEEFKAKYGYDLAPPKTWKEYDEIEKFLTEKYAPKIYGAGQFRQPAYGQLLFQERFRVEGGKFFDPKTMKATVNSDIGVKVFDDMRAENKYMPPGVETWGFVEALTAVRPLCRRLSGGGKGAVLGAAVEDRRQGRLCLAAGRQAGAGARLLAERFLQEQEQGSRLSVHPVAQQRGRKRGARSAALYAARSIPRGALHQPDLHEALGRCA
jgi:multiple sugar transport system substrate-binding protein